jgi:hypothetical protein
MNQTANAEPSGNQKPTMIAAMRATKAIHARLLGADHVVRPSALFAGPRLIGRTTGARIR